MSDGGTHSASRTALVALGAAALFGVAVAGGSVFTGAGTEATTSDALPYAALGAGVAVFVAAIAYLVHRQSTPDGVRPSIPQLLGIVFIIAVLGALVGTALTPRSPTTDEVSNLDEREVERRRETLGELPEGTVVRPVDFDGDGEPDLDANGDPILAYDEDGDGIIDGYLQPCPDRPAAETIEVAFRPRTTESAAPLDVECDGEVERILEFDSRPFTSPSDAVPTPQAPPATVAPDELRDRARDEGANFGDALRNVLIALVVIAIIAALAAAFIRWRRNRDDDADEPPPPPPAPNVAQPIARTIDVMERDVDPRQAIIEAYGTLLGELAEIGLPRRPEEAPAEHIARCLQRADLDEASVHELIELFSLARFSTHPVTELHRDAALRCLRSSVRRERDLVPTGAWPPPPPSRPPSPGAGG